MSDVKEKIPFAKSMNIDKRNEDFAYLRKNVFDAKTPGLYPAHDFYQERPDDLTADQDIVDIIGNEESTFDIKVIIQDGDDVRFHNLGSNSESNTAETNVDYECGTDGNDGVYICLDDDSVKRANYQNSNVSAIGTFTDARPDVAGFDGLYYWWFSNNEIYKQLPGAGPTVAFNNLGITPRFVGFYGDQAVIFAQDGNDIVVLFWDKSDTDLFDQRILVKNARLIAGGVVDGILTLVKGVGNSSNTKEHNGRIVVAHYDGQKFVEINSIKAGDDEVEYEDTTGVGIGNEVMVFSVARNDDSHNPTLYQNYLYKVHGDGAIEVQDLPDEATYDEVHVVRVFQNFICYAHRGTGAQEAVIFINEETNSNYADYEEYTTTEYVTNFIGEPYNDHALEGFMVAFEKLFEQTDDGPPATGEELDVYYRVSERDDFVLLMNVTVEKVKANINTSRDQSTEYASDSLGLPEQRYMISKMPDGESPLPNFNEIQYKFVSKRGFSVIGAWHRYSYTTRNMFA